MNCFWRTLSATSWRVVSGCWPENTTVATPAALMSILLTIGGSASVGRRLWAELTTRSTSTETRSALAALVNWTVTVETPCDEIETSPFVSMFGRPAIASSIGRVTFASIVSGSAPG